MDLSLIARESAGMAVVFLFMGLFWLWMKRSSFTRTLSGNGMQLVQCLAVGQKERILLLEIKQHHIVIGVSPAGMRTLHVFPLSAMECQHVE